jgi:hypothetical protein
MPPTFNLSAALIEEIFQTLLRISSVPLLMGRIQAELAQQTKPISDGSDPKANSIDPPAKDVAE